MHAYGSHLILARPPAVEQRTESGLLLPDSAQHEEAHECESGILFSAPDDLLIDGMEMGCLVFYRGCASTFPGRDDIFAVQATQIIGYEAA